MTKRADAPTNATTRERVKDSMIGLEGVAQAALERCLLPGSGDEQSQTPSIN